MPAVILQTHFLSNFHLPLDRIAILFSSYYRLVAIGSKLFSQTAGIGRIMESAHLHTVDRLRLSQQHIHLLGDIRKAFF